MNSTTDGGPAGDGPTASFRHDMFAAMWAAAALFHLAGNARPEWVDNSLGFVLVQLAIAAAAVATLAGPHRRRALLVLCALIPVGAFLEAPNVGNHWVLAALLSLAYLAAWALPGADRTQVPRAAGRGGAAWHAFAPAARLTVVVAYGFAAFAKLNSDFFDPGVSCAVYYHDQLVRSWGMGALTAQGRPGLGIAVATAAAVVELSVAVLLLFRRTRRIGLLLALPFHWLLALDWSQHFWDFSSVLFAGFLLFADDALVESIRDSMSSLRAAVRPAVQKALAAAAVVVVMCILAATVVADVPALRGLAILGTHVMWGVGATMFLLMVLRGALRTPARGLPGLRVHSVALLVPLLALFNGMTPYLEIKTGFGWNMYSNLMTVDGESNHFVIQRTLDLSGLQSDRVEIVDASDQALAKIVGTDYEIVYSEFREYAHDHPSESVTYRRGDDTVAAARLGDDDAGLGEISWVSRRLQPFRLVDVSGRVRCQSLFTPAR